MQIKNKPKIVKNHVLEIRKFIDDINEFMEQNSVDNKYDDLFINL
jgi:hypothetical protein